MTTVEERMERLLEAIATQGAKIDFIAEANVDTKEILLGTAKTGGLKERIAIAEEDIKRNKESYGNVMKAIGELSSSGTARDKNIESLLTFYRISIWILTVGGGALLAALVTGRMSIHFP